jgi:cardiolipin synthase
MLAVLYRSLPISSWLIFSRLHESRKPPVTSRAVPPLARTHENIYTIPNLLTASRLIAAPFIGYCVLHDYHAWAAGLFAYAGITDLLDGWIARKWNSKTVVGTVIDPMADKTLMTILTIALATKGALPGRLHDSELLSFHLRG